MKKFIAIIAAALVFSVAASAQPKAVGLRVANGAEISYQHYLGGMNFIEADLGIMGNGIAVTGVNDFHIASAGDFNFYGGPGASLGCFTYRDGDNKAYANLLAAIVGQIGAEYNIPGAPVNLSLDWRPAINFGSGFNFGWAAFAFGVRYYF